jgi:hypothetical protein
VEDFVCPCATAEPERFLFLADKDFDNYLQKDNEGVFKTEFYSIENYFCNPGYFEYVLRKFSGTHLSNKKIEELATCFSEQLDSATKKMVAPMAALCALRESGSDADFDSLSCMDFICLTQSSVSTHRRRRVEAMNQLSGGNARNIDCCAVRKFARIFSHDHFNLWLRGNTGFNWSAQYSAHWGWTIRNVGPPYNSFPGHLAATP